jgi:hypothetical protein
LPLAEGLCITGKQTTAQQGIRVYIGGTEQFAMLGFDGNLLAGRKGTQRRCLIVDFIAVDPQVSRLQAPVGTAQQAQTWQ